jgi:hypothetical protein
VNENPLFAVAEIIGEESTKDLVKALEELAGANARQAKIIAKLRDDLRKTQVRLAEVKHIPGRLGGDE